MQDSILIRRKTIAGKPAKFARKIKEKDKKNRAI